MSVRRLLELARSHQGALWWLHSAYALLFGILVMWVGARHFEYLRVILFQIAFIWLSSLSLPALLRRPGLSPGWRERLRLAVNYFNRNFYQQLLFFVLPIYYASTTLDSRNVIFTALLAASSLISTMDIVYDRYLTARWFLSSLFFVFSLFASINVMLPVLWSVSNLDALRISGVLALAGFATMLHRFSSRRGVAMAGVLAAAGLFLIVLVFWLAPLIPPAPLTLAGAQFGRSVSALQIVDPLRMLPSGDAGRIAVLTAVRAPLGLKGYVRHRWYLDGRLIFTSPLYSVTGGRSAGYRLWSQISGRHAIGERLLTVDVETEGGQLIGRAVLKR